MDRSRVAAILAALFGATSLSLAIARVAILHSASGLVGWAAGFAFIALIALASYLMLRSTARRTAGLMAEYLRVVGRAGPRDVVIPGWFWDGPDVLADFSELDSIPARMVVHAGGEGLEFLDESDQRVARVPWSAVGGIASSSQTRGGPLPVQVLTVTLPEDLLTIYPGAPRRRGTGFGWLNASSLSKTLGKLETLRADASAAK